MVAILMLGINCLGYSKQAAASAHPRSELYFIDNASTDGTREWAQEEANAGRLRYLPQRTNLGVAASWNLGLRKAFADGHDLVLVSNNDVVYAADTIPNLEAWHQEAGGFVGLVTVHSVGTMDALARQERRRKLDQPPDFAGFLISREIYERIGPFDEEYIQAFWEDLDYVIRMKDAGVVYGRALDALALHYKSRSIHEGGVRPFPQQELNRQRFIKKWGAHRLQEVGQ